MICKLLCTSYFVNSNVDFLPTDLFNNWKIQDITALLPISFDIAECHRIDIIGMIFSLWPMTSMFNLYIF